MVETVPFALITIGALHPVEANGALADIREARLADTHQGWRVVIVIEFCSLTFIRQSGR